jgi:hypothetical protein
MKAVYYYSPQQSSIIKNSAKRVRHEIPGVLTPSGKEFTERIDFKEGFPVHEKNNFEDSYIVEIVEIPEQ